MYDETRSRVENILQSTIDGSEYNRPPQSRVEELLLEIKEQGGGGSGTTDYNHLDNKPMINGHELIGNLTADDLDIGGYNDVQYETEDEKVILAN